MEIGKHFFSVKQILDAVPDEVRRVHRVPSFTAWMNKIAPQACDMSDRTVWHYYRNYSEALTSGLKPETVIALAPNVLKNEKPRKAVLSIISKNPMLATQLNDAANKPAALRRIAESDEIKEALKRVEAPAQRSRADRVEAAIIGAYRSIFITNRETISVEEANTALTELNSAIHSATKKLGVSSHLSVTFSPWIESSFKEERPFEEVPEESGTVKDLLKRLAEAGYHLPAARTAGAA